MNTEYLKITGEHYNDAEVIDRAARVIQNGGLVAIPTETVYGLVGRVSDPFVREKIYQLKHRDPAKHLGWFVPDLSQLEKFGIHLTGAAARLAEKFMPGPLTLIVKKADDTTVGFRITDHPQLLALLREVGEPLYQTSANRSERELAAR
jgi:L-threonylcarbamoyladenylate synthase